MLPIAEYPEEFDRRVHPRDELAKTAHARIGGEGPEIEAEAENISQTGMLLTLAAEDAGSLGPGDRIKVRVPTRSDGAIVEVAGHVVWRGPADATRPDVHPPPGVRLGVAQAGVRFDHVPFEHYRSVAPERWPEE